MNTSTTQGRQYFLDWLRILAFALLVPYHVGMYYVPWDWHVKSSEIIPALEPLMALSSPWRMGLLFLIAGAASAGLMQRGPGFVRSRSKRLLWPLLFGMLVIVPPQAYYEVVTKVAYEGSYLDFMGLYLRAYHGFCKDGHCLSLPTWNHLWFLPYLWVYSLIGWALLKAWPRLSERFSEWIEGASRWQLLIVGALPLIAARNLAPLFESTHNLSWDWYNHAQYLSLFLIGLLAARSSLWAQAQRARWPALALALIAWLAVQAYFKVYADVEPPMALRLFMRVVYGTMQWCCLMAACGFARQHLDADSAWRQPLSDGVFCVYILHQTLIVLLTRLLLPLHWPAALEGPLLIVLTLALSALGYLAVRQVPVLRLLMGVPDRRKTPDRQALAAAATMAAPRTES
ncbi:acyltransferase family protein [Paucibacter sp. APW11]|uniref:Acyltransferase family protein n=1 Tax=Roseateles aquae TaxID=3077235 RepID=A0ABU3PAP8_9BURK|nr:acyltransferase family protein [Paucibacter sp. APW11]MDT8999583.1 acyltransferase family protein [Paucibacter sp. APW11]